MSDLWSQAPQRQIRPFLSMLPGCAKEPQKMPSGSEVTTWRWRHLTPDTENQNTQREKYITSTPCSTPHHLQMMCCKAEEQISFAHCSKRSQSSCKSHWLWAPKRRHVQWSRYFMVSHRDCLSDAFSNPRTCSVLNGFATLAGILVQDLLAPSWTAHTIAARLLQSVTSVSLTVSSVSCCFILFYSLRRGKRLQRTHWIPSAWSLPSESGNLYKPLHAACIPAFRNATTWSQHYQWRALPIWLNHVSHAKVPPAWPDKGKKLWFNFPAFWKWGVRESRTIGQQWIVCSKTKRQLLCTE